MNAAPAVPPGSPLLDTVGPSPRSLGTPGRVPVARVGDPFREFNEGARSGSEGGHDSRVPRRSCQEGVK